jgi:hypothetical protein
MSAEPSNNTGSASCHYGTLDKYNNGYSMGVPPMGKVITGQYIVPTYDPIGYESLTAQVPSCSGYSSIESAYGKDAARCQTNYRTSLCGGGGSGSSGAPENYRRR